MSRSGIILCDLFDQMVDLLGDERLTPADFVDVVESGLDKFDLGITPPTVDQVLVGPADRDRACPPVKSGDCSWGIERGRIPRRAEGHDRSFRPRARRDGHVLVLELDPDGQRRLLDEPGLLGYVTLTQPSRHLILSRPLGDDAGRSAAVGLLASEIGTGLFPRQFNRCCVPRKQR